MGSKTTKRSYSFLAKVFSNTLEEAYEKNITWLSAALVFFTLLSLGPFLLIIMEVLQIFLRSELVTTHFYLVFSETVGMPATEILSGLVSSFHILETNILVIILSLIALFFLASQAIIHVKQSIDMIYRTARPLRLNVKIFLKRNLYGFLLVFLTGLSFGLFVIGRILLHSIQSRLASQFPSLSMPVLVNLFLTIISIVFVFIFFFTSYRFLSERHINMESAAFGAGTATFLFLLGGLLIGWYVSVAPLLTTYGFAGSLLFMLLWLYYSAHVLLFGAQLTYSHHKLSIHRSN
ncbi:MAG: YihY/virulence factor BrkB family protein [Candidatus Woesearchaeota archaeon]